VTVGIDLGFGFSQIFVVFGGFVEILGSVHGFRLLGMLVYRDFVLFGFFIGLYFFSSIRGRVRSDMLLAWLKWVLSIPPTLIFCVC
jgi:hypothetical protein